MSTASEPRLLTAARAGDEEAFRLLVEPYRSQLHAHCYRILGSAHDAEDALQDALLRAWRGLARFERRSSLPSWLYTIATNTSLDLARRWPKQATTEQRVEIEDGSATPAARYERRESVELAFVAAHEHLPARQRAALILREVLGFSAQETADALDTTVASVNSALQRARRTVSEELPPQTTLTALGDEKVRVIVRGYVEAWERDDVDAVVAMISA